MASVGLKDATTFVSAHRGPVRTAEYEEVVRRLHSWSNPVEGMSRFGIASKNTLGISIPNLRALAKEIGVRSSGIHEARILASTVDDPALVTEAQMERWARDFDSWDVVDQVCGNLFDKTRFAVRTALAWSGRDEEFVRRAGFSLMAALAAHAPSLPDRQFSRSSCGSRLRRRTSGTS